MLVLRKLPPLPVPEDEAVAGLPAAVIPGGRVGGGGIGAGESCCMLAWTTA